MTAKFPELGKLKMFQEGGRACYLYMNYIFCTRAFKEHPLWFAKLPVLSIARNNKISWFFAAPAEADFDEALVRVLEANNFLSRSEDRLTAIVDEAREKFTALDFSSISNQELSSVYDAYIKLYEEIGMAPAFLRQVDRALIRKFRSLVSERQNFDEFLALVSVPPKRTYSRQEEVAILELAVKVADQAIGQAELAAEVRALWQTFHTSSLGYFDEEAKSVDYFAAKVSEAAVQNPQAVLAKIIAEEKQYAKKQTALKESLPVADQVLIEVAGLVVYVKDHYKFMVNRLQEIGEPIFEAIARRTNYPTGFIKDLLSIEVHSLLAGQKLDEVAIKNRTANYAIFYNQAGVNLLVGAEAKEFEASFFVLDKNQTEFTGRVACRGRGQGVARVVLSPADFSKMEQGNILVVMNTSPDFVSIMQKAAAIVAEEGGITGHVSVVAREFGIPAVVGIGQITKLIQNGDEVEVDAEQGVVRILK